ncbi:MAG: hypothetical protein QM715_19825 [Nibricoccus sp.]
MLNCRFLGQIVFVLLAAGIARAASVSAPTDASPRVRYGAERLQATFGLDQTAAKIVIGVPQAQEIKSLIEAGRVKIAEGELRSEGYVIADAGEKTIAVIGHDDTGVLYGCLHLTENVKDLRHLPAHCRIVDAPVLKLRGPCIGMQKTFILPGRHVYEYPYTKELFPFFYDKAFWKEYLDYLAGQRMNTLYLWNGHPFASLVKLADYPYALEVSEEQFKENAEMFRYIAQEADKRGIWVVQMFYNILLSKPFAKKNGLPTQLNKTNELAADYTRKSIAEFVHQYPNVGLMICLGEALQDVPMQNDWLSKVILPGVKDGMAAAGLKEEPPVVVRTHATDPRVVMPEALKVYKNLYTEAKFNGESLTTWEPRGVWQQTHLAMSKLGTTHLANVHILANLEPFRYGAQRFIQKSVIAMRDRLGAGGLHLYPLAYWSWPDAPDKTEVPLKQIERDWIWFEAWARYAWNPDRDPTADQAYWIERLAAHYGTSEAAAKILEAYNDSGECAPRLLRRYGITEGNRQTLSLGMTLDQLVTPAKYRPYPELWLSQAPLGERLQEFADKEWSKQPHEGETPISINREVREFAARAVAAIEAAAPHVTKNREEFARLRNDIYCIQALSENYAAKAEAALAVLRYQRSHELKDMEEARHRLAASLDQYRKLTALTKDTYRFANTMQTSQRRIPVPGGKDGQPANYHWTQLLPLYENELVEFDKHIETLRSSGPAARAAIQPLQPASFTLLSSKAETYRPGPGARVFTDRTWEIQSLAPELATLTGIRFSDTEARAGRYVPIEFETGVPVQIVIGYVQSKEKGWRQPPELETDAHAGDQTNEPLLLNAATVDTLPQINAFVMKYGPGRHKLELRGDGSFIILGVAAVVK